MTARRRSRTRPSAAQAVRGIAMIEALAAMLIFMFGVLSLVGLQASLTKAQTDSKFRADATYLASEATGRMWSDLSHLASYNGSSCAALAGCKEWQDKVGASLPGGTGAIAVDTATGDVSITVSWTLPGGAQHHYLTNATLIQSGS